MMQEWLEEMADKVSESKQSAKTAIRKSGVSSTLAAKRLSKLKDLKAKVDEVKYNVAEEVHLRNTLEKYVGFARRLRKSVLLVVVAANLVGLCMSLCLFVKSFATVPLQLEFIPFSKLRRHTSPAVSRRSYHR